MANNIEINVVARDMASGVFNSITSQMGSFGGVLQGIASGNYLQAIASGFQFVSEAVNETVAYIDQVDDMSRAIGVTAEESSRLTQASERLGIEQGALQQALEYAVKKGMDVSIDGLGRLSTAYFNIHDPVDRAAFLMKTFGQNGEDMGRLMELGADGIKEAMDSVNDMLVVTDDAVKANEDYQAATEDLTDAWMGFKVKIGTAVIPALTSLLDVANTGIGVIGEFVEKQREYNEVLDSLGITWYNGIGYVQDGQRVTMDYVDAAVQAAIGSDNLDKSLTNQTYSWEYATGVVPEFTEKVEEATQAVLDLDKVDVNIGSKIQSDIENLEFLMAGGGLVQTLTARIKEGVEGGKITPEEGIALFQEAYLASQGIAIEMGAAKDEVIADIMEVFDVTLGEATALIDAWIADADGKTFNLTAKINYEIGSPDAFSSSQLLWDEIIHNEDRNGNGIIGQAWGGRQSPNTAYLVGERGPELFVPGTGGKIIPNHQLGNMGKGGGAEIDYTRLARVLSQELQKGNFR